MKTVKQRNKVNAIMCTSSQFRNRVEVDKKKQKRKTMCCGKFKTPMGSFCSASSINTIFVV